MTTAEGNAPAWEAAAEGLRLGRILISFQRFARPPDETVDRAPPSLGALPVAKTRTAFALPVAEAEAFWIGVEFPAGSGFKSVALEGRGPDGKAFPIARIDVPQTCIVPGVTLPDGKFRSFGRDRPVELRVRIDEHAACVTLMDTTAYVACTGMPAPAPLDPAAGYGGWRLP